MHFLHYWPWFYDHKDFGGATRLLCYPPLSRQSPRESLIGLREARWWEAESVNLKVFHRKRDEQSKPGIYNRWFVFGCSSTHVRRWAMLGS